MDVFQPVCPPFPQIKDEGYLLLYRDGLLLVRATASGLALCQSWPRALPRPDGPGVLVGWLRERPCHAFQVPPSGSGARAQQGPPGHTFRELRSLFGLLTEGEYAAAVTAAEVLHFARTYRLCPSCGRPLSSSPDRWQRSCAPCGVELEPRAQPTVLGLFYDGVQVLLAQPVGLPREMYSLPATPVGPGESLEGALGAFLGRTLGLKLPQTGRGLSFFGSQPWPHPDRLIVGLHGQAPIGPLTVDPATFTTARWFHVDDLPPLPAPISLARRMTDWYAQLPRVNGRPALPRHSTPPQP